MDCGELRDMLRAGSLPSGPGVAAHLARCEHCTELLRNEGDLGRALGRTEGSGELDEPSLWSDVRQAVERESGLRAWLRSRPTPERLAIAFAAAAIPALLAARGPRTDWATYPVLLKLAWGVLPVIVLSAALPRIVFSLDRETPGAWRRVALAALGIALPFGLALYPTDIAHAVPAGSAGSDFGLRAVTCFGFGMALAAPFFVLLWALDRADRIPASRVVLAGTSAGLVGNLALFLHCPIRHPEHLVAGHAMLGLALILAGVLLLRPRAV